jgi:hypothetical protein
VEGCDNKRAAKIKFFFGVVVVFVGCYVCWTSHVLFALPGAFLRNGPVDSHIGKKKTHRLGGPFFFFCLVSRHGGRIVKNEEEEGGGGGDGGG